MIKDIKYNGYSAQPSDYECQDGDLAVAVNLVPEDGALKPIGRPKVVMQLAANNRVAFIHETSAFIHYIIYGGDNKVTYVPKDSDADPQPLDSNHQYFSGISHFNAVGNTLIAFTDSGINYFLWKDNAYVYLGNHLPEIDVSFGLVGHPRLFSISDSGKSRFKVNFAEKISYTGVYTELSEANKTAVTEQIMAKVNRFIHEQTIEKGRFCFPFFVRYALRLYDGSLVCHSAPILMNPQTSPAPLVLWKRIEGSDGYSEAECDIMLVACDLDYKVLHTGDYYKLDDWSDIVSGIDVFISKPIYTYDQEGKISSLRDTDNFDSVFIGRIYHKNYHRGGAPVYPTYVTEDCVLGPMGDGQTTDFLDCYAEWEYKRLYELYFSPDRAYPSSTFHMPELPEEKVGESLRSCATFYKLRSLAPADIKKTDRDVIPIDDDYLQSLVTREVMTDDYLTHDILAADSSYAFNNRLNLAGIYRKPFRGFLGSSMFAWCSHQCTWQLSGTKPTVTPIPLSSCDMTVRVFIKENGREYAVQASDLYSDSPVRFLSFDMTDKNGNAYKTKRSWGCYLFYPNVNAHKMLISNSTYGSYLIALKPHEFLNGAFALLDYGLVREVNYTNSELPSVNPPLSPRDSFIPQLNKVVTSQVNNPFYFPLNGINTIGTGRIIGICSAAKALSQGQFGQFPLYAFTDEGVWAMELSSTGLYSARQPITRDVCINAEGITQIDSSVLFPTDRGIMIISGSQTQCISDIIKTEFPFDLLSLPHMQTLHDRLNHDPQIDKCLPVLPFTEFLQECRMIYDYVHQRIIVYNPAVTYAYVYSLKSRQWGMIYSNIADNVNSYPNALAMDSNGNLVDFTLTDDDKIPSMLVSRPVKLETPDVLKTMDTVIQRGNFRKGHVQSVLYGSRDLINWHLVWSSKDHFLRGFRGSPYKYFRIALVCSLSPDESIFGASLQFCPRQTNQPR